MRVKKRKLNELYPVRVTRTYIYAYTCTYSQVVCVSGFRFMIFEDDDADADADHDHVVSLMIFLKKCKTVPWVDMTSLVMYTILSTL